MELTSVLPGAGLALVLALAPAPIAATDRDAFAPTHGGEGGPALLAPFARGDVDSAFVAPTGGGETTPRGRWAWPLTPRPPLVRRFEAPASVWGAGHRGLDLGAHVGAPVRAVADGTVSHAGVIAGRGTVSVRHATGIRSTYEPLDVSVAVGERVRRGQVIGRLSDAKGHCQPSTCLHLGAKRGNEYLDPLPFFGWRVILLPVTR